MKKYPKEYYQFFEKFNQGEYYECHDLLEEIWMTDKQNKFLQGMLQVAVAIYHFQNGNIKGAKLMFDSSYNYLLNYQPRYWDLELQPVLEYIKVAKNVLPNENRISIGAVKKLDFPILKLHLDE